MTSRIFWLASFCGALLVTGCSSSNGGDGGTDGGAIIGTLCDPTAMTDDLCAPSGFFCLGVNLPDGGISGSCVLPSDQDPCIASVGCVTGFSCIAGVFATGTTCVQQCTQTTDCVSVTKICVPQLISMSQAGCGFTGCGASDGGSSGGNDYYTTCDAQGSADGTCIPFTFGVTTVLGLCVQGGTVAQDQPCAAERGAAPGLCQPGLVCVNLTVNTGGGAVQGSACEPVCSVAYPPSADGGPGCASQSACINIFDGESYGACFVTCNIAGPNCPAPLVCLGLGDPNTGICGPG